MQRCTYQAVAHLLKFVQAQLLVGCPEVVGGVGPVGWVVEGAPSCRPALAHTHLQWKTGRQANRP
jgi:hypothetical protein